MNTTNVTATRSVWPLPGTHLANARPASTWIEWSTAVAQRSASRRQSGDLPFSDRELAHLAFLRWLFQTGQPESVAGAEPGGR